jgi:succinate dehydrogenase/fumarate reductase flavoprotein subunit
MHVETDVLIIGSGGAGMYAAIEATRRGCDVFLVDRSLIGRGGATVMAQMTVAVALGSQTPDHWSHHYDDTLEAGRGLCDERRRDFCAKRGRTASARWTNGASVGRARTAASQACPSRLAALRLRRFSQYWPGGLEDVAHRGHAQQEDPQGRRPPDRRSRARRWRSCGAVALHLPTGSPVTIAAKATIVATGGLTRLIAATAPPPGGDCALALRAGAPLVDMEFVQFFPIDIWRRG